ncbi:ribosome dissociation factor [Saccharomycopsis crataegensis]|uniref:Protein DOM34 homolog n=1 Tax=Saccharomycopsis crataegensis TaxID=43959 RepID=A0AAV5QGM2_9ASCO|nr:ribosome dissociation factor [Saccharomycopsis crataegensis]
MKLLGKNFNKKESYVVVQAEDDEDIWILYNFLQKGDRISCSTFRIVTKEGSNKSEKVLVRLVVKIEDIHYEAEGSSLRCKGRTVEEHKLVPLGSYHTVVIDTKYSFKIFKDSIDRYAMKVIHDAVDITNKAEVGTIILQEGIAHFCLLTNSQKVLVAKVEKSIPKKRRGLGESGYETAMKKFYGYCYDSFKRKFELEKLKVILIASPGTIAKTLYEYIMSEASKDQEKMILQSKDKFVIAHSFNGYLQSLDDTLKDPEVQKRLENTKFIKNILLLENFFTELNKDTGIAWYGKDVCVKAIGITGAVKHLLLTDTLFRSDDPKERQFYIRLSDKVRSQGGESTVFSSRHDSGEQLDKMTGIAVILNYPMPELDDESEDEED